MLIILHPPETMGSTPNNARIVRPAFFHVNTTNTDYYDKNVVPAHG